MIKIKWLFIASMIILLLAMPLFTACPAEETPTTPPPPPDGEEPPPPPPPEITLYIGGTQSLTGAFAEDTAALLAGLQDYVDYVNETKMLAPWRTETFPDNVTLEVLWRDDELNVDKALSIYEELKAKGILTYRCSGTVMAMALLDRLNEDRIGATSMASGPYLMAPPKTIFTQYPIYTDECAAVAEWFMESWEEDRAPRFAYLTNDTFGRSILIPEMDEHLEGLGYEIVGTQIVPMVPTAPPTTQLLWLKENNVDLTFGCMINPGSQPTIKEAVRLGMGPHLDYNITFGFAAPAHLAVFCPAMGVEGDGVLVGGSYPPLSHTDLPGIAFCNELLMENRPDDAEGMHIMYPHGVVEGMIQVEAVRLALLEVAADELTPADVLEYGFYMIKDLNTGEITSTPLTYGPDDIEGVDMVRLDQSQGGEAVFLGNYPTHAIFKHE